MKKVMCFTAETSGLENPTLIEIGWGLLYGEDYLAGGIHLLDPGEANWEPEAFRIHQASGLVADLQKGAFSSQDTVLSEITEARLRSISGRCYTMLWSPWLEQHLGAFRTTLVESTGGVMYGSALNVQRRIGGGEAIKPNTSRSIAKLATMRELIREEL